MNPYRIGQAVLALCTLVLMAEPVDAQEKTKKQAADEAFRSALAFAADGNYAAACPLLERVQELDPTEGALFALADCREREGRIATAHRRWRAFVHTYEIGDGVMTKERLERLQWAKERIQALKAEVPQVKFVGGMVNGQRVKVILDGAPVDPTLIFDLDPGEHRFTIVRPGVVREKRIVNIERGHSIKHVDLDVVDSSSTLEIDDYTPKDSQRHERVVPNPLTYIVSPKPTNTTSASSATRNRTIGIAGVTIGGAGFLTGSILGIWALSKKDTVVDECVGSSGTTTCSPVGLDAVNEGRTLANAATIPLVFGAAFAAASFALIVRNPKVTATAGLSTTSNGLPFVSLQGRF